MNIKIGDFVKGITNDYGITNTKNDARRSY